MYLAIFLIISLGKRQGPSFELNYSFPKDFSSMYFRYFEIISPWRRAGLFIWTNLDPLHQRCIVPSFVEIGEVVLEKNFKYCQYIFAPWNWTNLVILYPRMYCAKFGWNWRSRVYNFLNVFSMFRNYFPLNILDFLLPKHALCQVWLIFWKMRQGQQQRQRRQTTDKLWSEKLTWASVSGELKREGENICLTYFSL